MDNARYDQICPGNWLAPYKKPPPVIIMDYLFFPIFLMVVIPHLSRSHSSSENSPESLSLATPREATWDIETNPFEITHSSDNKLGMKIDFNLVRIRWVSQQSTSPLLGVLAQTMVFTKSLFHAQNNHNHWLPVVVPHWGALVHQEHLSQSIQSILVIICIHDIALTSDVMLLRWNCDPPQDS